MFSKQPRLPTLKPSPMKQAEINRSAKAKFVPPRQVMTGVALASPVAMNLTVTNSSQEQRSFTGQDAVLAGVTAEDRHMSDHEDGTANSVELQFASLDPVPESIVQQSATSVVSFQDFISLKANDIYHYLKNSFVLDYETMEKPKGLFDYIGMRKKNVGPFNRMMSSVGMHYKNSEQMVTDYILFYYRDCLHDTESYKQLVALKKYFINYYLNYLHAPTDLSKFQ